MPTQTPAHAATGPESLTGRVALVTGSTSGIARALTGAGAAIVLNGFGGPDQIADAEASIAIDFGVPTSHSSADMSDPAAIANMIETTLDLHGRLDILVNNAGLQHVAPVAEFPPAKWNQILAVNLGSAYPVPNSRVELTTWAYLSKRLGVVHRGTPPWRSAPASPPAPRGS